MRYGRYFFVIICAILLAACQDKAHLSKNHAIKTIRPEKSTLTIYYRATLNPNKAMMVYAPVSGRINLKPVSGQYVKKNQLLLTIDPDVVASCLNKANRNLIKATEEAVALHTEFDQLQTLCKKGLVDKHYYRQMRAYNNAIKPMLRYSEAKALSNEFDFLNRKLYSPVDGRVTHLFVSQGAYVKQGEPLMCFIAKGNQRGGKHEFLKLDATINGHAYQQYVCLGGHQCEMRFRNAVPFNVRHLPILLLNEQNIHITPYGPEVAVFDPKSKTIYMRRLVLSYHLGEYFNVESGLSQGESVVL